jgi:hypothetical protein
MGPVALGVLDEEPSGAFADPLDESGIVRGTDQRLDAVEGVGGAGAGALVGFGPLINHGKREADVGGDLFNARLGEDLTQHFVGLHAGHYWGGGGEGKSKGAEGRYVRRNGSDTQAGTSGGAGGGRGIPGDPDGDLLACTKQAEFEGFAFARVENDLKQMDRAGDRLLIHGDDEVAGLDAEASGGWGGFADKCSRSVWEFELPAKVGIGGDQGEAEQANDLLGFIGRCEIEVRDVDQEFAGDEDLGPGAKGEGEGVAGTAVDLDVLILALGFEFDSAVVGGLAEVMDDNGDDFGLEAIQEGGDKVVGHGAWGLYSVEGTSDGLRFREADPDGEQFAGVRLPEEDDGGTGEEVHPDGEDLDGDEVRVGVG